MSIRVIAWRRTSFLIIIFAVYLISASMSELKFGPSVSLLSLKWVFCCITLSRLIIFNRFFSCFQIWRNSLRYIRHLARITGYKHQKSGKERDLSRRRRDRTFVWLGRTCAWVALMRSQGWNQGRTKQRGQIYLQIHYYSANTNT